MRQHPTRLVVLVLLLVATTAPAQDTFAWHTRAGEWAFAQGDLELAADHFRDALEAAQALPTGDPRMEEALGNLARVEERRGGLDAAQPLYELLLAAREARLGSLHPSLLDPLVAASRVAVAAGDVPAARRHLDRYLEIAAATDAAEPGELHRMLLMRSRMHVLADEPEQALPLLRLAVQVADDDPHASTADVVSTLRTLAGLELASGDAGAGEAAAVRAAELASSPAEAATILAEAAQGALAGGHLEVAEGLANQAVQADPAQPPAAARDVLAEVGWLSVRTSTDDPAALLGAGAGRPRLAEVEARLKALLEARPDGVRSADPAARETLKRLVAVTAMAGQGGAAAAWQRMLTELDPENPDLLDDLVELLAATGRPAEAAAENAVLISLLERRHGASDPRLLPALDRQEELLRAAGEKKAAKQVRKRAKRLRRALR